MKFTEAKLELAITELLAAQGYEPCTGEELPRADTEEVLLQNDLSANLAKRYAHEQITAGEIENIVRMVDSLSSSDL